MVSYRRSFTAVIILLSLSITACSQTKSSPEKHARHYVYMSEEQFDPNFKTNKADSARMMVPFFKQFWMQGDHDRAAGVSSALAQQRVAEFHSDEFLNAIHGRSKFAGKTYSNSNIPSDKNLRLLADEISGAYMDGYQGIQ